MHSKALEKTQLKRDTYRVLGCMNPEEALKTVDANLFNDHDYYQLLLNDFLSSNDRSNVGPDEAGAANGGAGDDEYLYGADLSLTQKFLAKRQKMKEL